jgi:hypothetical protein
VEVVAGQSPAADKKARREGRGGHETVRKFGDRYYREQVMRNRKSPAEILRYLEREIYPAFGDKLLKDVTALDVQALVYRKRDNGGEAAAIATRQVISCCLITRSMSSRQRSIRPRWLQLVTSAAHASAPGS